MAIAVHPIEAKSLQELIDRVNTDLESTPTILVEPVISATLRESFQGGAWRAQIVHVPFRSSGESVAALVAGQVAIVIGTISSLVNYHKSGQVRILAVFSEKRSTDIPDVPTATELGMPRMIAAT